MLDKVAQLARSAGDAIMQFYTSGQPTKIWHKADHTPVTEADLAAHTVIKAGLSQLTPDIPLLSEEEIPSWQLLRHWRRYWLVDPLDGTKEFIKRNGEFTVNIALIEEGTPVLGVIHAPAQATTWLAEGNCAWRDKAQKREQIHARKGLPPLVVVSRSPINQELREYLQQIGEHQTIAIGSSLKFCLIAEGQAQLYPRFGPTCLWDTAAGHAIAVAAGAHVNDWQGKPLDYTLRASFINPGFRVSLF